MNKTFEDRDGASLSLPFGLSFSDLYRQDGLVRLDAAFLDQLGDVAPALRARLEQARLDPPAPHVKQASDLIIELAPYLEDFIGEVFGITAELRALQNRHSNLAPLYSVKRRFVQRKAVVGQTPDSAARIDGFALAAELEMLFEEPLTEVSFANHIAHWLDAGDHHAEHLQIAAQYAAWATLSAQGKAKHGRGVLFKVPHKLDPYHLVPVKTAANDGLIQLQFSSGRWRRREGFQLTDPGTDLTGALDQAHYCIKCHNQGKDSCSTGLKEKNGAFKSSVFGVTLAGCPLDEKISEMNVVKRRGQSDRRAGHRHHR